MRGKRLQFCVLLAGAIGLAGCDSFEPLEVTPNSEMRPGSAAISIDYETQAGTGTIAVAAGSASRRPSSSCKRSPRTTTAATNGSRNPMPRGTECG